VKTFDVLLIAVLFLLFCSSSVVGAESDSILLTPEDMRGAYSVVSRQGTSVHDPSIVLRPGASTYYYVFGSHNAVSYSKDLWKWNTVYNESETNALFGSSYTQKCSYNKAFKTNKVTKVMRLNEAGDTVEVDFGNYDASAWSTALKNSDGTAHTIAGNMWAPDVIYNPVMKKWCMYLSLNGPTWNSVIILLTAGMVQGPYVYQGPVVYSGFNVTSAEATSYKHTDLEIAIGNQPSLPSRYQTGNKWGDNWPHCIDPCVYYDKDSCLWLCYGSWSGGIYTIELDESTGLRDYCRTYKTTGSGKTVKEDPYFGIKIAGGCYVSGEGPYIYRDGDYYYLFVTYGGLNPDAGYEMRLFRSKSPSGPFKDIMGNDAIFTSWVKNYGTASNKHGNKVLGNYRWDMMTNAEVAQGHNSAVIDPSTGNAYLVYHTKFNNGTSAHQVRVHQLLKNAQGWPLATPYEYHSEIVNDDSIASSLRFDSTQLVGEYQVMSHPYAIDYEHLAYSSPKNICLNADGTITGQQSGTWKLVDGTSYVTINLAGTTYYGCFVEQTIDLTNIKAVCFTALSGSGVTLWGSKADSKAVVALNCNKLTPSFKSGAIVSEDLTLPVSTLLGGKTTWKSSDEGVISTAGKVTPAAQDETVTMTAMISHGIYYAEKSYNLTVKGNPSGLQIITASPETEIIYNILGQRVERPLFPGIYLINGDKVLVK